MSNRQLTTNLLQMSCLFVTALFIGFLISHYVSSLEDNDGELVFASILYRHGERNPESFYPNDQYKNLSYWPDGLGALTNNGKLHHYQLGRWLRKRYSSLIPDDKYSQDLVYVQSTDVDRTVMSALSNLAGMFYPSPQEKWCELNWQPVPVHTTPKHLDKELLIMLTQCPKIKDEEELLQKSDLLKEFNEKHEDLYNYLTLHTGDLIQDPTKVRFVFTNLYIESQILGNNTLPEWTKSVYPDRLYAVAKFGMSMLTMTKTMKRLRGGPLLKEIISHMKQKRSGILTPNRNLWVYSGHDVTVSCLLDSLGVFQPHLPPHGATVMIELRKTNKDFYVLVYYKDSKEEPTLMTIPGCTSTCPLDTFETLLSEVLPGDWEAECQDVGR